MTTEDLEKLRTANHRLDEALDSPTITWKELIALMREINALLDKVKPDQKV